MLYKLPATKQKKSFIISGKLQAKGGSTATVITCYLGIFERSLAEYLGDGQFPPNHHFDPPIAANFWDDYLKSGSGKITNRLQ